MAPRTFTHLYDDYDDAIQTMQALTAAGVPESDISLVANTAGRSGADPGSAGDTPAPTASGTRVEASSTGAGTGATAGTIVGGGAGLLAGLGMLAIPGVGPVIAAGWLVATLTGAGIGAAGGGLLGSLVGAGMTEEHAHAYAEGVRRGGTLLSVRADDSNAARIESLMQERASSAVDVEGRRADYQAAGWSGHDALAEPYTPEQVAAERERRVGQL